MRTSSAVSKSSEQPLQIDIFSTGFSENPKFSKLLNLYHQIPHYVYGPNNKESIRQVVFTVDRREWVLENTPAVLFNNSSKNGPKTVSFYPSRREELVMAGLLKLAALCPVYSEKKILGTRFYLKELRRLISSDDKVKLSTADIKRSLRVLKNSSYNVYSFDNNTNVNYEYQQITEMLTSQSLDVNDEDDDRYCVYFNSVLTNQILTLKTRLYNFERFRDMSKVLSRPLYVRLCLRFVQAAGDKTYTVKLSTARELGGLSNVESMAIDKRRGPVIAAFNELKNLGVIRDYELTNTVRKRPDNAKGNRLKTIDEVYLIHPATTFVQEQIKASAIKNEELERLVKLHSDELTDASVSI